MPTNMLMIYVACVGFASVCMGGVNLKFTTLFCTLTNCMHKCNQGLSKFLMHSQLQQELGNIETLKYQVMFILTGLQTPLIINLLAFHNPCIPLFVGNFILPSECPPNLTLVPANYSFVLTGLISLFHLFNWSFLIGPLIMHLCLVLYQGYSFTLYISSYCG